MIWKNVMACLPTEFNLPGQSRNPGHGLLVMVGADKFDINNGPASGLTAD
jgi:hypothetical protein